MGSEVKTTGDLGTKGEKPTPRRRRWLIVLSLLIVLGSLLTWSLRSRPPVIEALSPDGKFRIRFISGGIGKIDHHPDSDLYLWFHKLARDWMPVGLFRQLPSPQNVFLPGQPTNHGVDRLMVMFDVQGVDAAPGNLYEHTAFNDLEFLFEESTGALLEQRWSQRSVSPGHTLMFDVFPRRDRLIKLQLVDRARHQPLMSFTIRNDKPSNDQFSQTPTAVPWVLTTPELQCTLRQLKAGPGGKIIPQFEITPLDAGWKNFLLEPTLEDATGNRGETLSPSESCWKVAARVSRRIDGTFAPGEIWQSPAFTVPEEISATTLGQEGRVDSTSIKLLCVKGLGMGHVRETDSVWSFSTSPVNSAISLPVPGAKPGTKSFFNISMPYTKQPFILLEVNDLPPDNHLLVLVRDQDGRTLGKASDPRTRYMNGTRCRCAVEFEPKESTKEVTATVIISKPQVFEFFVAPPAQFREKNAKADLE